MIKKRTTLILGAGASRAFGYPIGTGLRDLLIRLESERPVYCAKHGLFEDIKAVTAFASAFRHSELYSIDAFLARRKEFWEIGKRAVASVLLEIEARISLNSSGDDHWYQYLWNTLAADSWETLDFSKLSVITFNYDRTFEHYLLASMRETYGKSLEEAIAKLDTLQIIHVYGSLGPTIPIRPDYFWFGTGFGPEELATAARHLRIIPEGRHDDGLMEAAKGLIRSADVIAFLGFGFDETNLRLLGAPETFNPIVASDRGNYERIIVATCVGKTTAEISHARDKTTGHGKGTVRYGGEFSEGVYFRDAKCLELLRETMILAK